ncbi:uncharacterized protein LOC128216195 [Mya arenaria]|uniref:uncharacterized protein LOC128216195 n=1 Tax=Mya arenaria TaxID=6604 RepID=UPI0022E2A870|nr:uncharacterized protein LOC128216195 [Mya arenaria]
MIDITSYIYSLKLKWIKKCILNDSSKCFKLMSVLFDVNKMLNFGKKFCEIICQKMSNTFWKDVINAYMLYIDRFCIDNVNQFMHMPLFYNHNFVNGNYVFIHTLYNKGFRCVKDVFDANGNLYSLLEIEKIHHKWLLQYENVSINWKNVYSCVFKCTKDSYIQWLQLRVLHRILPTNSLLYKMKVVENDNCSFCECCKETLLHLFWDCNKIQPVLQDMLQKLNTNDSSIVINSMYVLLGSGNNKFKFDILLLEYKKFIFLCKRKKCVPTVIGFRNSLQLAWNIF